MKPFATLDEALNWHWRKIERSKPAKARKIWRAMWEWLGPRMVPHSENEMFEFFCRNNSVAPSVEARLRRILLDTR